MKCDVPAELTHILMSVHAGQVQRRVSVVVLSIAVCLVMQQQELGVAPPCVLNYKETKREGEETPLSLI